MGQKFLLELEETSGGNTFTTHHLIEADDRQMVKYHYHRTLKDWGWHAFRGHPSKHCLQGPHDSIAWISQISRLSDEAYSVMRDHLYNWTKV